MKERQVLKFHKLKPIPLIALLACLSISSAYGQVSNPSTGDTIAKYCSNGICSTGPQQVINHTKQIQPVPSIIGSVKLTQSCIGKTCTPVSTPITQLGKIGVKISQTCETLLKNHMNSSCLTYNELKPIDNTNPLWAGLWVEQPYEHRLAPKVRNHENFNPNPWVIMVDPNPDFTTNALMITVQDKNFTWIDKNGSSIGGTSVVTHVNRYMSGCAAAIVAPNVSLVEDTIKYLESNCTVTSFNDTKIITQKEIPFSYDNPYSTLHQDAYLKSFMHSHTYFNGNKTSGGLGPTNCITHQCAYTDPYKKQGY